MKLFNKQKVALFASSLSVASLASVGQVQAHGFTQFPKARQAICQAQGGYWWPYDGSGISNLACRAAFLESGYVPFVQEHEISVNVANYHSIAAVKEAIPDGKLCSAGSDDKHGLNLASPHWQKTTVVPDDNGEIQVRFNAQTPHNPSFWEFYLSKPSFNADTDELTWGDLELVQAFDDTPFYTAPDGNRYYDFQVKIPEDRNGQALLFTRWQRYDPAGEGFYNCSDIIIDQEVQTPDNWFALSAFVRQGQEAKVGDSAWLRLFDETGQELINEVLLVSEDNVSNWQANLAQKVTSLYPALISIGIQNGNGDIEFDQQDLASNQVWSTNRNYSYQLSIQAKPDNRAPVIQPIDNISMAEGERINLHAHAYDDDQDPITFSWSSIGPINLSGSDADIEIQALQVDTDTTAQVSLSVFDGELTTTETFLVLVTDDSDDPTPPPWQADINYVSGDKVVFNNVVYVANWWNNNEQPDQSDAWKPESDGGNQWRANNAYQKGEEVIYNEVRYRARWWTQGEPPGEANVWEKL